MILNGQALRHSCRLQHLPASRNPSWPSSVFIPRNSVTPTPTCPCKTKHLQLRLCPHQPLKYEAWLALLIPALCAGFFLIPLLCFLSLPPPLSRLLLLSPIRGWFSCQDNCTFWNDAVNLRSERQSKTDVLNVPITSSRLLSSGPADRTVHRAWISPAARLQISFYQRQTCNILPCHSFCCCICVSSCFALKKKKKEKNITRFQCL